MESENSKQERCEFCQCPVGEIGVRPCLGSRLLHLAKNSVPSEVEESLPIVVTTLKACQVKMR